MKAATALAILPILALAAPAPIPEPAAEFEIRDGDDDPNVVVKFDAFATASTVTFNEGTAMYVGQENSTDLSLFRFPDGGVYSIAVGPSDDVLQYPRGLFLGSRNANLIKTPKGKEICEGCTDESQTAGKRDFEERTFEERTFGLLFALIQCKINIITSILSWLEWICGIRWKTGCLDGYPGGGHVWVGGSHGTQCGHRYGYLHHPHVPELGSDNGWGGKYCGSYKGVQYWKWQDGRICGAVVHRHRRRNGCDVPQRPSKPPVCNRCYDPSEEWWNSEKKGYWNNRNWWNSRRSINELD